MATESDVKTLLKQYSDDYDLIEGLSAIINWFTIIENSWEFVTRPIEWIINDNTTPYLTIEMCQLIDRIRTEEGARYEQEISKDLTDAINDCR